MKASAWNFLCEYIQDKSVQNMISEYIVDKKHRSNYPRKFHKDLPDVPKNITKGCFSELTVWCLITYEGCNTVYVIPEVIRGIITPENTQRAIKVTCSKLGVFYNLYQTNADERLYIDIEDGIRTYKRGYN